MNALERVVVVGASAAGLTAAETLRRRGYSGSLTIIGDERCSPYDRPPLSKQVLQGSWAPGKTELRPHEALAEIGAEWLLGTPATGLDVDAREVSLADGKVLGYDGLVIATGVSPRPMPFAHDMAGVHLLRTLDDAIALRDGIRGARSVAVIGGGFMGSEIAAVTRGLGRAVTLIDLLPAPMITQLGAQVANRVADLHVSHGVTLRCGVGVSGLTSTNGHAGGHVNGVDLSNGAHVDADLVVVAIGAVPATGWLDASGLRLGNGIECDQYCQAAPGVVAAGDVAAWEHPGIGQRRVEHRMNATTHATAAVGTLLGDAIPYNPVSYFWTDQYDVKIQAYGSTGNANDFQVVAGDPDNGAFAGLYAAAGHVTGALTWNMPRQARLLRQHVINHSPLLPATHSPQPVVGM